tara:strand:- start:799 stop:1161 length:363 start_codon:yes stop_codon:yes gene_type:complete
MKKVVRLTENELNRLVKRIVNEAPFDTSGLEKFTDDASYDDKDNVDKLFKTWDDAETKYKEYLKNGIPIKEEDVKLLLSLSMNFCTKADMTQRYPQTKCPKLTRIKSYVDDIMSQNFSKY